MDDKELLELAAKAAIGAGMNIIESDAGPQIFERHASDGTECYRIWNPLTDDGDALRLAVKLSIRVYPYTGAGEDVSIAVASGCDRIQQDHNGDPYSATRLAIVRAAAEIGRAGWHRVAAVKPPWASHRDMPENRWRWIGHPEMVERIAVERRGWTRGRGDYAKHGVPVMRRLNASSLPLD